MKENQFLSTYIYFMVGLLLALIYYYIEYSNKKSKEMKKSEEILYDFESLKIDSSTVSKNKIFQNLFIITPFNDIHQSLNSKALGSKPWDDFDNNIYYYSTNNLNMIKSVDTIESISKNNYIVPTNRLFIYITKSHYNVKEGNEKKILIARKWQSLDGLFESGEIQYDNNNIENLESLSIKLEKELPTQCNEYRISIKVQDYINHAKSYCPDVEWVENGYSSIIFKNSHKYMFERLKGNEKYKNSIFDRTTASYVIPKEINSNFVSISIPYGDTNLAIFKELNYFLAILTQIEYK